MKYPRRWDSAYKDGRWFEQATEGASIECIFPDGRKAVTTLPVDYMNANRIELFDHHAEPAAGEKGEAISEAEKRVRKYRKSVLTERGHDTYHGTSFSLVADLTTLADAYMQSGELRTELAELRTALAASHEREKAERAGRAAAERLDEARLRTIHGLTMRLELEKPKRHAKK